MKLSVLIVCLAALAAVVAGGALPRRTRVAFVVAFTWIACVAAIIGAGSVLAGGRTFSWSTSQLLPFTGVTLVLGSFGALFVVTTAVVALASTTYWLGYARHSLANRSAAAALPLFIATMMLLPMAASVATFLALWELMALSSLVLVAHDHARSTTARSAAQWYAIMTHAGAGAILLAFVLLSAHAGAQTFSAISAHASHLSPAIRSGAFVLAIIGFGSKAGAVPLHVWLPKAHGEAPSPVSALMSGAMVNLGIYGIVLVGDQLLGGGALWWWLLLSGVGVVSALFGALYAATSTDVKRLLAYSTTDNMGLVLMALGASGLSNATGHHVVATLAMVAALALVVNHALFKGTLFLAAGSVQRATGTRDLDQLGGLLRRMPVSGVVFLVGALSISAVPPFNGFVSEWLLLQSLLHGLASSNTSVVIAMSVSVAALALTGGLTVVAFVKATGIGLLGRPRSPGAAHASEVSRAMQLGAGLLASGCVVVGLAPMLVLPAIERAARDVHPAAWTPLHGWITLNLVDLHGALAPGLLAGALLAAVLLVTALRRVANRRRTWSALRASEPWGSGRLAQTPRMQYTATSFAEPLQRVFDDVVRPTRDIDVTHVRESRYYIEQITYRTSSEDVIEKSVYRPIIGAVAWWGRRAGIVQNGSVHRYLAYGFVALVVILAVLA